MSTLTQEQRDNLPSKAFGVPDERRFPIPDAVHAIAAKRLIGRAKDLSEEDKKRIIRMANAKLSKS